MKRKEYERQMRVLHGELAAMQEWVKGFCWPEETDRFLLSQVPCKPLP
jgi:hypothetical protein